jgi:hypothetical protein
MDKCFLFSHHLSIPHGVLVAVGLLWLIFLGVPSGGVLTIPDAQYVKFVHDSLPLVHKVRVHKKM